MELVALLRLLSGHRIALAAGAVVALALGASVSRGPTSRFGVASLGVVLDTPKSELLHTNPVGAATLSWRADLLTNAIATDEARSRIARAMSITPGNLAVSGPARSAPPIPTPLPRYALDAAAVESEAYQLAVEAPSPLPIVRIDARAPSRLEAGRLAETAAETLRATASASKPTNDTQDFRIEDVGPTRSREIVDGPRRAMVLVVVVVTFGLWCACIALAVGLGRALAMRRRREAAIRTRRGVSRAFR